MAALRLTSPVLVHSEILCPKDGVESRFIPFIDFHYSSFIVGFFFWPMRISPVKYISARMNSDLNAQTHLGI